MTDLIHSPSTRLPLAPGTYVLDKGHVQAGFAIRHLGVAKVRGLFKDVDAELVVGPSLEETSVSATIQTASIDSGNPERDAHVRTSDLLDVEKRPTITFRSTEIVTEGDEWQMRGDLTIGQVTRPITFDVEFGGVADFYDGTRHAGFSAVGEVRRKDFGLAFGAADALLGQAVKIELDVEFLEPTA